MPPSKETSLDGIHRELRKLNSVLAALNENFVTWAKKPNDTVKVESSTPTAPPRYYEATEGYGAGVPEEFRPENWVEKEGK